MTTNELADLIGIKSPSIHRRVCTSGSYFGLHPNVLPNGRLVWPDDALDRLLNTKKTSAKEADHAQP